MCVDLVQLYRGGEGRGGLTEEAGSMSRQTLFIRTPQGQASCHSLGASSGRTLVLFHSVDSVRVSFSYFPACLF